MQASDLDSLKAMYSKISLTATIIAKSKPTDAFSNITDVVNDVLNSVADQFDSKIKVETLNITKIIKQNQRETLKTASDYSESIKSQLMKFYSQFKANVLQNLGYVNIPNDGQYLVSEDFLSW
jgi:hypothetical protein